MDKIKKIVFLIGTGHSASTLLDMMLSGHSEIRGVGEMHYLTRDPELLQKLVCSCGNVISKCKLWSEILSLPVDFNFRVERKKTNFLFNKPIFYTRNMAGRREVDNEDCLYNRLAVYDRVLGIRGGHVILDSSKDLNEAELLCSNKRYKIIFIHLVRDGRGVVWSFMKKKITFWTALRHWVFTNLRAEIIKRRNGVKYINVKYERFVENPDKMIKKILSGIGLEYEPVMLNYLSLPQHQLTGNRMRFNNNIQIKEDIEWKMRLPILNKLLFLLLAGWLNYFYKFTWR